MLDAVRGLRNPPPRTYYITRLSTHRSEKSVRKVVQTPFETILVMLFGLVKIEVTRGYQVIFSPNKFIYPDNR